MKRIVKGILYFTLILSISVSVLSFTGCERNRKYDEGEVLSQADKLLRESERLNGVLFGSGIGTVTSSLQSGVYYEADAMHLAALGFTTVKELKELCALTFSVGYCESIYSTLFESITDSDGYTYSLARYYQSYEDEVTKDEPRCIMVYRDYKPLFKGTVSYNYSTLSVKGSKGQRVYVAVNATVTDLDGNSQDTVIEFALIEEDSGWRIDSPTFANYNPYLDEYKELEGKI